MIVNHRAGSYDVKFLTIAEALSSLPARSLVVTDRSVTSHFPTHQPTFLLEPGEGSKTPETYLEVIDWLAQQRTPRNATLVALGGGVVGDVAGFAAATYMRGIRLLQIPTTLLAQVDSSVGGKVGVDLPGGKNLLGAFYPPSEVRICVDALSTLPLRQFTNGMAEVLKYGFIMKPSLLDLAKSATARTATNISTLVETCIDCKRQVVEADEFETTGLRAILNFGHTVGHALEAVLGYEELLHGEAISVGMVAESVLSERLGLAPNGTAAEVRSTLSSYGLPTSHAALAQTDQLLSFMRGDKKAQGSLTMSLLRGIGHCELVTDLAEADVIAALQSALVQP